MSVPPDKDVLGKADALLRRAGGAAPIGTTTGAVPVLTELIDAPPEPGSEAELARAVFDRVWGDVEGRLAAELERRLAQHLVPQVHTAVASAIGDLRQELANSIGDAIKEALGRRNAK